MTRKEVARMLRIAEATLRGAEDNGILPTFDPDRVTEYMNAVQVWRAARAGGASTQKYRTAIQGVDRGQEGKMTTSWLLEVAVQDQADMIAKLAELQGRGFKILRGAEEDHIEGIGLDREEVDGLRARHEAAPPPIIDERERRYLSRQRELSLTVEPGSGLTAGALDPHDELAIRADEIQAAFWMRKGIRISQAEAVRKAFVSDPTLFQRLQKAAREKAMARVRQLHPNAQWVRRK